MFWNINRKPLQNMLADLAQEHDLDFLILAECDIPYGVMVGALNSGGSTWTYSRVISQCSHIIILTRFPDHAHTVLDDERMTVCRISLPLQLDILLSATHFPPRTHWGLDSLNSFCQAIATKLRYIEEKQEIDRTIVVGDLNLDPFDSGVIGAHGFHAVMTKTLAQKGGRVVQGTQCPFFYNPMWNHYGDAFPPSGTHYHYRSEPVTHFWHMYDQVLIRPSLVSRLEADSVRIIHRCKGISLLAKDDEPDTAIASDHLPVLLRIDLQLY